MKKLIRVADYTIAAVFFVLLLLGFAPKIRLVIFALLSATVVIGFFYLRHHNITGIRITPIVLFFFSLRFMGSPAEIQIWFEIISLCSTFVFTIIYFSFSKRSLLAILVVFLLFYVYCCGVLSLANVALANKQDEVIESAFIDQKYVNGRLGFYTYSFDVVRTDGTTVKIDVPVHVYEKKNLGEYVTIKGTGRFYLNFELWE